MKDLVYDQYGMIISVSGKTGARKVRVVGDSVPEMRQYQEYFNRYGDEDYLFIKLNSKEPMNWADVNTMFYEVCKRAGIKRRVHPHPFGHTIATILAKDLKEAPLEATMGWVHVSKMSRVYMHLSDKDIDNAVLKVYGIEVKEEESTIEEGGRPEVCLRCYLENPSSANYCLRCSMPLDEAKAANQGLEHIVDKLQESIAIPAMMKAILKNLPPEVRISTGKDILDFVDQDNIIKEELKEGVKGKERK